MISATFRTRARESIPQIGVKSSTHPDNNCIGVYHWRSTAETITTALIRDYLIRFFAITYNSLILENFSGFNLVLKKDSLPMPN